MKKIVLFSIAVLSAFVMSCNDKKSDSNAKSDIQNQSSKNTDATVVEEVTKREPVKSYVESVMIDKVERDWTLCKENEDGTMKSAKQTSVGDSVSLVYIDGVQQQKKAVWKFADGSKGEEGNWLLVKYVDEEFWTRDIFVADTSIGTPMLGVVISDSHIYKSDDEMTMTKDTIKQGTRVVYYPDSKSNLSKICVYSGTPSGKIAYVDNNISVDEDYIEYFSLIKKLDNKDLKPVVKEEISQIISDMEDKFIRESNR